PYTVDVLLTLDLSQPVDIAFEQRPDFYSDLDPAPPSEVYDSSNDGKLTFTRLVYDQAAVVALIKPKDMSGEEDREGFFSSLTGIFTEYPLAMSFLSLILVVALVGLGYSLKESNNRVVLSDKEYDDDVLEAEIAQD
ncbi:MAG: hypothetical protein VXX17_05680, partial [Candidatus Thermoplasmatota archaeon]|nr:hypothetical protein [Candidatus Thermoplasmatota archaeon]